MQVCKTIVLEKYIYVYNPM